MNDQIALVNMIKQQLRTGDVLQEEILNLYDEIPRHEFVPEQYQNFAYSDLQIPLNDEQRMMTPLEEGILLQSLNLNGTETVLEIGTGSGFLTALLSKRAKQVISIEYFDDLAKSASQKLKAHQIDNVEVICADACQGWLENAPYDVIVMTAALENLTETHRLQLIPGGKIFAVLGKNKAMQGQLIELDHQGNWSNKVLFETSLPPMIDKLKVKDFIF